MAGNSESSELHKENLKSRNRSQGKKNKENEKDKDQTNNECSSAKPQEKSEKPVKDRASKQAKIDSMLTNMAKDSEPSMSDLVEIINTVSEKINNLVSKDYIDKCMENVASQSFVSDKFTVLKQELSDNIKKDFDKVYEQLKTIKQKLLQSSNEINDLKNENEAMQLVIDNIKEDMAQVKDDNKRLEEKIECKDEQIKQHQVLLNEHEQYSRRNNIRIYGLEDTNKEETALETAALVVKLAREKLNLNISVSDIDIAHRMGKYLADGTRPVICKFLRRTTKKEIISVRKNLKGTAIVIREDLTIKNAKLLEKVSSKQEVKNAWSDEGKIIALLLNGKKLRIDLYTDLSVSLIPERELKTLLAALEKSKTAITSATK